MSFRAFTMTYNISKRIQKSASMMWRGILRHHFSSIQASTYTVLRKEGDSLTEVFQNIVWSVQDDYYETAEIRTPLILLYNLTNGHNILSAIIAAEGECATTEDFFERSLKHITEFLQTKNHSQTLDTIPVFQALGRRFRQHAIVRDTYVWAPSPAMELANAQDPILHDAAKGQDYLPNVLNGMKDNMIRQFHALAAHSELEVLTLWAEILAQRYDTRPDASHQGCKQLCCIWRKWATTPHIERVEGELITLYSLRDRWHFAKERKMNLLIACAPSTSRAPADWEGTKGILASYCENLLLSGGARPHLVVGQAHGRRVRFFSYTIEASLQPFTIPSVMMPEIMDVLEHESIINQILESVNSGEAAVLQQDITLDGVGV